MYHTPRWTEEVDAKKEHAPFSTTMANTAFYDSDFEESGNNVGLDDDSDAESLVDIQSPSDGYFEQRDHPQQRYVQNPAADPANNTAKEEAEVERLRSTSSTMNARLETRQERWADEENATPMLDAGPAPPDYEAATAGQREQRERAFRSDHPLVRNGLLGEHGVFGSRGEPESMTDPASGRAAPAGPEERDGARVEEPANEETQLLRRSQSCKKGRTRRAGWCSSRCWKRCLMVFGIVVLIILAIVATQKTTKNRNPFEDGGDPDTELPIQDDPPDGPTPPHPSHSGQCSFNTFSETTSFDFTSLDSGFEFLELIDFTDYRHLLPNSARISGTIQISPATQEQEDGGPDIRVWVNVATTRPISIHELNFTLKQGSLQVLFPEIGTGGWYPGKSEVCFDIAVAVHVRKGTKVRDWRTKTANMDVVVEEGVFGSEEREMNFLRNGLVIENGTEIFTTKGGVRVAYWQSRRTVVETFSGDIEGTFALRDLLSLSSRSGDVNVDVDPKKADDENPVPAEFLAKSFSGDVRAEFPTNSDSEKQSPIPDRDYRIRADSKSGDIRGTYILGRTAEFSTRSGDVKVNIMPYSANLSGSTLETDVKSGKTELELLEPYHADSFDTSDEHREGVIDALRSLHKSNSGDIKLKYPREWEGRIDGETASGDIRLRGKDVEIWADPEIPSVMKRVIANKGRGHSELKFTARSGDVDALIGDE